MSVNTRLKPVRGSKISWGLQATVPMAVVERLEGYREVLEQHYLREVNNNELLHHVIADCFNDPALAEMNRKGSRATKPTEQTENAIIASAYMMLLCPHCKGHIQTPVTHQDYWKSADIKAKRGNKLICPHCNGKCTVEARPYGLFHEEVVE